MKARAGMSKFGLIGAAFAIAFLLLLPARPLPVHLSVAGVAEAQGEDCQQVWANLLLQRYLGSSLRYNITQAYECLNQEAAPLEKSLRKPDAIATPSVGANAAVVSSYLIHYTNGTEQCRVFYDDGTTNLYQNSVYYGNPWIFSVYVGWEVYINPPYIQAYVAGGATKGLQIFELLPNGIFGWGLISNCGSSAG